MRLFFGLEVHAPWPDVLPHGRHLAPEVRHITLAFLGEIDETRLIPHLTSLPIPTKLLGWSGHFTSVDFFPHRHPHVAAWCMEWRSERERLFDYQTQLSVWLKDLGFTLKEGHSFNPHVTLCRSPFKEKEWRQAFQPLPFYTGALNLYQSLGHSAYKPIWTHSIHPPFIEVEHTADIAFQIFGSNKEELFRHAQLALAFKAPLFLQELDPPFPIDTLESIIKGLNWQIGQLDQKEGTPFKAVSYHGDIETKDGLLIWEMIVDV